MNTSASTGDTQSGLQVWLVSASQDRAGTWGVFEPGLGDDNGNGIAIANDWTWKAALQLDSAKSIKLIQIREENSNQIWTTEAASHWPLVVFYHQQQLNHKYGEVLGPFAPGTQQLDLSGQIDNRKMYGTHLCIEFTDGTTLSAEIPRSSVALGKGSQPTLAAEAPAPLIYGNLTVPNSPNLIVDVCPEPVITRLKVLGGREVSLEAKGVAGRSYTLESAATLAPPVIWQPVATNTAGADGVFSFNTTTSGRPACFYRLRSP